MTHFAVMHRRRKDYLNRLFTLLNDQEINLETMYISCERQIFSYLRRYYRTNINYRDVYKLRRIYRHLRVKSHLSDNRAMDVLIFNTCNVFYYDYPGFRLCEFLLGFDF